MRLNSWICRFRVAISWLSLCVAAMIPAMVGCGGQSFELETAPVSGVVTLDGQPLSEGLVQVLTPKGRSAKALIQSDGTFEMSSYGKQDGVQVGTFPVTVSILYRDGAEENSKKPSVEIPKRYSRPATSGLKVEVKSGQSNELQLSLTTKPAT